MNKLLVVEAALIKELTSSVRVLALRAARSGDTTNTLVLLTDGQVFAVNTAGQYWHEELMYWKDFQPSVDVLEWAQATGRAIDDYLYRREIARIRAQRPSK